MSEFVAAHARFASHQAGAGDNQAFDNQALAQVEKWMAVIREIANERQGSALPATARLERLLASATE